MLNRIANLCTWAAVLAVVWVVLARLGVYVIPLAIQGAADRKYHHVADGSSGGDYDRRSARVQTIST